MMCWMPHHHKATTVDSHSFLQQRAAEEARKQEVAGVRRECEDLQKRLAAQERRVVQLQHEVKRKEKEYERLQER